jgi:hypothetical protein
MKKQRGRPKKNPDEKLSYKFDFRMDKKHNDDFIEIAKSKNITPSELGRQIILNWMNDYQTSLINILIPSQDDKDIAL